MAVFERSPDGIANRALFFDVDYVAYHEGSHDDEYSLDFLFWSNLFKAIKPNTNVKFLAAGSKTDIIEIADNIDKNPKSVLFLLDRDYDDIVGVMKFDESIIYTYGYSFENDIATIKNCAYFIYHAFPVSGIKDRLHEEFNTYIDNNKNSLQLIAVGDQKSKMNGVAGIGTANFQRLYVDSRLGSTPDISHKNLEAELQKISDLLKQECQSSDDWGRRLNGHFLLDVFYRIFTKFARTLDTKFRIDKKYFCRALISTHFHDYHQKETNEIHYYKTVLGKI
ncbi:DUF4435 domain-containing protein [Ensifer sp. NPDC090286]|uniref:DUF4435 domain-containing protein n=1 Tax=Ensifer sp. NPDC090286 TaxID=3363991 RepID=UPI00383A8183